MRWVLQICFLFLLTIMSLTTAQDHENCFDTGNFTTNSRYANNRNLILSTLASNVSANGGFYTATVGEDPNKVYTLALCRGDSAPASCARCVDTAIQALTTKCPNQTEAISWGADPPCIVRYANRSFYGILELDPMNAGGNTNKITTNLTEFNQIWENLMVRTVIKASSGSSRLKYATEEAKWTPFQMIYALMQCTPDISKSNCDTCLRQSVAYFQNSFPGSQGGYVQRPTCLFRWDLYPFYNETADAPLPSPPTVNSPPQSTNTTSTKDNGDIASVTIILIVISMTIFIVALVFFTYVFLWKRKQIRSKQGTEDVDDIDAEESMQFDLATIRVATNNFSTDFKLGQGGFGSVYKGKLPDGQEIAVKRLSRNSGQGEPEFKNEVLIVARLQHRNLVRLLGFCLEGNERILIYEFFPNSSLDKFVFDPIKRFLLDWETRYKIIGGIARGILYLHEDSRLRIIHRDIKASNILLDADMNPKISDFGMAKLFELDQSQGDASRIMGTFGYMAPEYVMHRQFSVKSDVFSFGVLVLEIISGQKISCFRNGEEAENLLTYAWENWRDGTALNLVDSVLRVGSSYEMMRCIHIALLCVQENVSDRPTMASVALMLSSCTFSLPVPSKPAFFLNTNSELANSEFTVSKSIRHSRSSRSATPLAQAWRKILDACRWAIHEAPLGDDYR